MHCKKHYFRKNLNKSISIIMTILLLVPCSIIKAAPAETPEAVYNGIGNASVMINNMDFNDVKNSDTWAKQAIYESSGLDIMKGYGNRQFGRLNTITKEQAIAIAYRMAGREAEAQKLGETLDNARKAGNKKTDALSLWSDGYLQLAANEGLISAQDLKDAFTQDQTTLTDPSFHRDAPAQRQEMAFWAAKTLKLQPAYGQQKTFNSYNDWKLADPLKVPYIESILQNSIMNGDGKGNFSPTKSVTREQVAQIVKNVEGLILPIMKYEKKTGTIEGISSTGDLSQGENINRDTYNVRNSNGKLDQIITETLNNPSSPNNNELSGKQLPELEKNLVVYKNGQVGNKDLLKAGDKIDYIVGPDKTVKFVNVVSSTDDTKYIEAQINSIDSANSMINVKELFGLTSNDLNSAVSFDIGTPKDNTTYRYSNDVLVSINNEKSDIKQIDPGMNMILTIRGNTVTEIKNAEYKDQGVVKGVVEDNNPQLGYITLYNESGSGTSPDMQQQLAVVRTYGYTNPGDIEILKNHEKAKIEDIEPGDTAFLKIDSDGNLTQISAVDNYMPKYGRVISVKPKILTVQYDDGSQQVLDVDDNALVIADKKLVGYNSIKDGDRVKLQLDITNKFTKIKEITIEGDEHLITNIYKGTINYIDQTSDGLVIQDLMILNNGQWKRTDQKGVTSDIKLADDYNIYAGNKKINIIKVNNSLKNNEAYVAVEKDYGGNERAVLVAFRNEDDTETLLDDSIASSVPGAGEMSLSKNFDNVKYNDSTIVIKDNRLVTGNSIAEGNTAYIVANRSSNDGETYAGIVQIGDRPTSSSIQIYRGRIQLINDSKDFTVESFSQLNDLKWDYANTPKTFKLVSGTRILDDSGVVGQRNFLTYGTSSYKGKTVYVLSNGVNADLISTVSYGVYNVRGEIQDITGMTIGSAGTVLQEPTGFTIRNTTTYDLDNYNWADSADMTLNILKNSIILKNNKIAKPSDLKKGDKVRVIRKDGSATGDAYIVMVENG